MRAADSRDACNDACDHPRQPALEDAPVDRSSLRMSLNRAEGGEEDRRQRRSDGDVHDVLVAACMRQDGEHGRKRWHDDETAADGEVGLPV